MELMESRWTDDGMDDLKHQVDELARRTDAGFTEQRREMNARFEKVDTKFEALSAQIASTHEMVIGLNTTLTRFSLWFAGAMAVTFVSVLLTLWLR